MRFASGNHLESAATDSVLHHRSDEYLMEVVGEGGARGSRQLLEPPALRHDLTSASCPAIEAGTGTFTPVQHAPACDVKLALNGRSLADDALAASVPLLADV